MGQSTDDVAALSGDQRVARYRQLAREAENWAFHTQTPEARASYLALAEQWRRLADMVESELAKELPERVGVDGAHGAARRPPIR